MSQDDWDPDWHATSSSKVAYLVEQLKAIQNDNLLQFPRDTGAIMEAELTGPVSNMWQTLPKKASTSVLPEKAIVFSQFLEHINVIEAQVRYSESRTVQCIILVFIMDVEHNSMTVRILEWEASFSIIRMCSCWELDCLKHPYKCWPNVNSRKSENYYCIYQNHIPTLIFWFFMLPHKFDFSSLVEVWAT